MLLFDRYGVREIAAASSGLQAQLLPYSGGMFEQPALMMDAVNIYGAEVNSLDEDDRASTRRAAQKRQKQQAPVRRRR